MSGSTPTYGLPYLEPDDPPDIASATQDLAEAAEAQLITARTPPVAQLRQTSVQTLTHNNWAALSMQAEDHDSHGGHSTSTNTSRYTCPTGQGGVYELAGAAAFAANATGQRWCRWARNGTELNGSGANMDAAASGQTLLAARTVQVTLAPGDYVELQALQTSGVNVDTYVGVGYAQSTMTVKRVTS